MSKRSKTKVTVKPVPIKRSLVQAQAGGEVTHAFGGSAAEVEIAQQGIARRLVEKVVVCGVDSAGFARDQVEFSFTGDGDADVMLDLEGGARSAIDALDSGLGRAVAHAAGRMRKRGLKADVRYVFSDEVYADAGKLAAARAELGIGPCEGARWRSGYQPKEILRLRPAKDKGMWSSFSTEFGE